MAYELYMGNILCPVTPSKLQLKIKNQNKTMNLINGTEINVLKEAGLTEVSYDLLLPNVEYPRSIATYKSGFVNAQYFLNEFEKMKTEKKSFIFKVIRTLPSGKALYDTEDLLVSLEDYTIKEDAKQGFDVVVSIKLKQYRHYGTKIVKVSDGTASVEKNRETTNSPAPTQSTTYTVKKGDTLWAIAKACYGDGSKYTAIHEANKDKIANPSLIYVGQVLTIPGVDQVPNLVASSVASKTASSVASTTNSDTNANKTCNVTINFAGIKLFYGKARVYFVLNGKSGTVDFPNSARFQVDKGSWLKICPIPPSNDVTYTIKGDKNATWSNISSIIAPGGASGSVDGGKQAIIKADTTVEIYWRSR